VYRDLLSKRSHRALRLKYRVHKRGETVLLRDPMAYREREAVNTEILSSLTRMKRKKKNKVRLDVEIAEVKSVIGH